MRPPRTASRSSRAPAARSASPRRTRSGSRSVAAGFIVGLLLPSSRVEDRKLGPIADDVKEKAKETGQEALQRGQQVAQEAAQSAQQTVQEKGKEHGQELASSAQENMQEATSSTAR